MNRSSKFNFFLPQNTDPIEVSDFNANFETIDANLLTKAQSLTDAQKAAVRANVDLNVANNLTTTAAGYVLDARQGKVLGDSVSSLYQKYFSLDTAPDIPNNSNFNSLTTPGCYRVRSYSSATTMTNIPEFTAGVLYVKNSMLEHGSNYRQQIYMTHQDKIYLRMTSDGGSTWTSWDQLVSMSAINTFQTVTPVVYSNRVTIQLSNCYKIGRWVIVYLQLRSNFDFMQNTAITGLPVPAAKLGIPINISGALAEIRTSPGDGLVLTGVPNNTNFVVCGVYNTLQ